MKKIEEIINNPKNEKFLLATINKLENKIISINHKKIKLTKELINQNKEKLLHNLKQLILMIIHIESDGNYKVKNKK
jgi:competence transcription factor ComK